jgi:hypothetical protein
VLRERLAGRFASLREASARLVLEGAEQQGFYPPNAEAGQLVGMLVNALGNGLALEKLVDPDSVPDSLYGDMLVLIFQALQALARELLSEAGPDNAAPAQASAAPKQRRE